MTYRQKVQVNQLAGTTTTENTIVRGKKKGSLAIAYWKIDTVYRLLVMDIGYRFFVIILVRVTSKLVKP